MDPRTLRAKQEYEDKHFYTKDGEEEFVITNLNSVADVTVKFVNSGLIKHTNIGNIKMGLPNPFAHSCVAFDTIQHELLGNVYRTNQGYFVKIIKVDSKKDVWYQFLDEFGYIGCTTIQNIRKGQLRNPYHRNEFGGYLGEGPYNGNEFRDLYNLWHSMLVRGTGARDKYSEHYGEAQRYANCAVCNEWLNYNNFAAWYMSKIQLLNPNYAYEIDKDLLFPIYGKRTNGIKLYSPITCVLIPHDLNIQFANYNKPNYNKDAIRASIISMTEGYYKDGALDNNTYNAIKARYYNDGTARIYNSTPEDNKYYTEYHSINNSPEMIKRKPVK